MKNHLWKLVGVVALLAMLIAAVPLAAEEPAVGPINSLRVYKQGTSTTTFPYTDFAGPFDLTHPEAPGKDFVVFNPAIITDQRPDLGLEGWGDLGAFVTCDNKDAAQKVHARMWYERICEPLGKTFPVVPQGDKPCTDDIVFEYTYIMLDDETLDPVACPGCNATMVFPMVGGSSPGFPNNQIGLEGFDVNNDGIDEVLKIERVYNFTEFDTQGTVVVSPKSTGAAIRLEKGDVVEFFDYAFKVIDSPTTFDLKVEVAIYYTGFRHNQWIFVDQVGMYMGDFVSVDARQGPARISSSPQVWMFPEPIVRPWFLEAVYVGTNFVEVKPYRILTAGETFFVDGAEYDVAAIYTPGAQQCQEGPLWTIGDTVAWRPCCPEGQVKYITIRNPLPKGTGEVQIPKMSVLKSRVPSDTSLPMLPPFNMWHNMVDDTNIPDNVRGTLNTVVYPKSDVQYPDNVIDEACPGGFGAISKLDCRYNTIWKRIIEDVAPYDGAAGDPNSYIAWTSQTKEDRFDTNLFEEKFTEPEQTWEWINIETKPWDYTEFILPLRPDITDPADEDGDYILVSSWRTQHDARVKFVYDAAVGKVHSADIYVNDAEYNLQFRGVDANSLRVYGLSIENAAFPYGDFMGPFDLTSEDAPEKDFIVHNPAYFFNKDGGLNFHIKADADANQKVHLRTWYVPKYPEPYGATHPVVPPVTNYEQYGDGDIVNEYTYLLLDDLSNDPTHGTKDYTQLIFPMASGIGLGPENPQVGLDRYDVNRDGTDEIMRVMRVMNSDGSEYCAEEGTADPQGTVIVGPQPIEAGNMRLGVGEMIEFLDYGVKLVDTSSAETQALFDLYYLGWRYDRPQYIGSAWLSNTPWGLMDNTVIVEAGKPPKLHTASYWDHPFDLISEQLEPVIKPWAFLLDHVSTNYVSIRPYRILTAGETFFVDGAEYDVAAIGVVDSDRGGVHGPNLCALKYITIRNPVPKCVPAAPCPELFIPGLTVYKTRFGPQENLPVLPPFNMVHDRIDDVNVPETCAYGPDVQSPDNPAAQDCVPTGWKTIRDRRVKDVDPLEFFFIAEEKETRFDTNLLEEKFIKHTELCKTGQCWQWINIETLPWHFTEFVLPEIPQARMGNYLLVSSFTTQDNVRVKFTYDPADGTGLYVNSDLCEPARVTSLTSNSPVKQYATIELFGTVVNADDFAWDFGELTGCTGENTLSPTCPGNVAGEFQVSLTAMNECGQHTATTTVEVIACLGDFAPPFGFRDLADIMKMLPYWNLRCGDPGFDEMFDITGDCRIGLADIMQVVAVWNTECPGGMP